MTLSEQGADVGATTSSNSPAFLFTALLASWCLLLLIFHAFPGIDLSVSRSVFSATACGQGEVNKVCGHFSFADVALVTWLRNVTFYLPYAAAVVLLAIPLISWKRFRRDWRTPISELCCCALASLAIGCGILVNVWLKGFAGRPRPRDTDIFGGGLNFVHADSFAGKCISNCSFVSGEASAGGWLFCLLLLLPTRLRVPVGVPLAAISILIPILRVMTGAHYVSDAVLAWLASLVVFAGILALPYPSDPARHKATALAIANANEIWSAVHGWLRQSTTTILGRARKRLRAGYRRFFANESQVIPTRKALLERPTFVLAVFFLASLVTMAEADLSLGLWMQSVPKGLHGAITWLSDLGTGQLLLTVTGVILLARILMPLGGLCRSAVARMNAATAITAFIFLSVAGGGLASALIKNMVGRARPELLAVDGPFYFRPFAFNSEFAAFPSGHSATAGAMAMSIALVFPALRPFVIALGVSICLSRQMIGAHWASDTMMGWAIGAAFAFWLAHQFARRRLVFKYGPEGRLLPLPWRPDAVRT